MSLLEVSAGAPQLGGIDERSALGRMMVLTAMVEGSGLALDGRNHSFQAPNGGWEFGPEGFEMLVDESFDKRVTYEGARLQYLDDLQRVGSLSVMATDPGARIGTIAVELNSPMQSKNVNRVALNVQWSRVDGGRWYRSCAAIARVVDGIDVGCVGAPLYIADKQTLGDNAYRPNLQPRARALFELVSAATGILGQATGRNTHAS